MVILLVDRRQKAKFDEEQYRLPSHIDMVLDLKLNAGSALSFNDYGTLCRGSYNSITEITDSPTPENMYHLPLKNDGEISCNVHHHKKITTSPQVQLRVYTP